MDSSFTYFSKIKGPVPTGLRFMSEGAPDLSNCAAYSAERIDAGGAARFDRKTALGDLSVTHDIWIEPIRQFDFLNQLIKACVMPIRKLSQIRFTEWHLQVTHAFKSKNDILAIEFTAGHKPGRDVKFHAVTQPKGIDASLF